MKTPALGNAGGGIGGTDKVILADSTPCPHAAECRIRWTFDRAAESEGAECGFCYQPLSRSDLARILAGPPRERQ